MNARLEWKLRYLAVIIVVGTFAGVVVNLVQGRNSPTQMAVAATYGFVICISIGVIELFVLEGPLRDWLNDLSFTANLVVRSAIYAVVFMSVQLLQTGELVMGLPRKPSAQDFWSGIAASAVISVIMNLAFSIANIIGPRAFLNFVTGRYHSPVEENRFVLFVDIAGSTGLAERLGGVGIHRFLDRTFRLLTLSVVDYRGEVLNYVGDEVIVTWPESIGAVDCRPLQCFMTMRETLERASVQFDHEFGAALHFGSVIVGEIGDVKRAIVFNGDVMNTAARLEELSRKVNGGFLASRAAMARFVSPPPFPVYDLGQLPIRGRADGVDVVGIGAPAPAPV